MSHLPFKPSAGGRLVRYVTASTLPSGPTPLPNAVLTDPAGVPAGGSLSRMLSVADVMVPLVVAPPVGNERVRFTMRTPFVTVSSNTGTENDWLVCPGANVRMPLTGTKLASVAPGPAEAS